jgi:Tfp pilus assembly protein PilX
MKQKRHEDGFILMIVCMVLLVVAIAAFAFMRVQSAQS